MTDLQIPRAKIEYRSPEDNIPLDCDVCGDNIADTPDRRDDECRIEDCDGHYR